MKIGTITFHCSYNFGSALQTYALRKYLTSLGHDVHVIDYRSDDFRNYWIFRKRGIKSSVLDVLSLRGNLNRRASFQSFWRKYFNLTDRTYEGKDAEQYLASDLKDYDVLICGSDQIWNLDCTSGPVAPFFLSFAADTATRIAYAPSLSHSKFEEKNFTDEDKRKIAHWLHDFAAISVRELLPAQQFQALTEKPFVETLDPTLLLDVEDYREIQAQQLPKKLRSEKYVFAYTLWPDSEMVNYLDKLAHDRKLTIVYYSKKPIHYISHSVNVWGIGPAEFLALIDNADCVVSNSFHATVFSILYGKPFLTFGTGQNNSRMETLLGKLGMSKDHLLPDDFRGGIDIVPFSSRLDSSRLSQLRECSEQFLNSALAKTEK
ncbi:MULTISPECIES: polysaccharide pyruvyl transferase family protein [Bifidobacterium]|uniref:Polysaccharide pyruvyl transferase family protein n=1 Tax=Bifidobacterium thermacidophilum TaxID=246618 RepID=A0ABW8KSS1_9BIFI|nr:polysaccharide pyruvyl transferase family protein [Bifidobacterium thermophilum]MDW8486846.1 polysaccharide pyruvyl transferase family protein [Bifidobacterium thermophilum]